MKKIQLSNEQKKRFAGIFVLDYMNKADRKIPVFLDKNDEDLEPVLEWLMAKEYIEILNQEHYEISSTGKELLKKFLCRYSDYLKMFDIFCAVDLEEGVFAFENYFHFEDQESWIEYINDDRWEDLRIAVAEFKKIDPVEIVFMSFINESRFGRNDEGWQFDLLLGSVWDEILEICETSIHWQELGYEDEEGSVEAEDVIIDIIEQGAEIMLDIIQKEKEIIDQENEEKETMDECYIYPDEQPISYYENYRDPYYISPIWLLLLL